MYWILCIFYKKVVGFWVREGGSLDRNKSYFVYVFIYLLKRFVEIDVGFFYEVFLLLVKIFVVECLLFFVMFG